jgi:flagellar M-ring protein FliF
VFAGEEKQPTASVTLKLRQVGRLNGDQVAGIVRLVSSAVEGLKPERVTIVDTEGNMLSEPTDDATGLDPRMSSSQLRLKKDYERQVQQDIQSMLERVLGENKAVVRVCAKINFDRVEQSKELYEPLTSGTNQPGGGNTGVLTSETRLEESYGSGGTPGAVGGVPGVAANRPGARPSVTMATHSSGNGYQRVEASTKYEVSKTTEHTVVAPGQVEKLSVAVMLDKKVEQSKVPQIQNVIATAAGIDANRGDQVTVMSMAFDDTAAKKEAKDMQAVASRTTFMSVGKSVAGVLLLFGFLFFLKGMLKQIKVQVPEPTTVEEIRVGQAVPPLQGYDSTGQTVAGTRNTIEPELNPVQPQDVAKALRAWISES